MTPLVVFIPITVLILIACLAVYYLVQNQVNSLLQPYQQNYFVKLLGFTWRAVKILLLIWTIFYLCLYTMAVDPWPERRVWDLSYVPLLLSAWLNIWMVMMLPAIPSIVDISNYLLKPAGLLDKTLPYRQNVPSWVSSFVVSMILLIAVVTTGSIVEIVGIVDWYQLTFTKTISNSSN